MGSADHRAHKAEGTARPFVIAFVARSGSTAIKNDLAQHPRIEMRAEAMGGARLPPYPGPRELSDDNRLAWLDHHWRPEVAEGGVAAGFKLQFNRGDRQFDDLDRLAEAFRRHRPVIFRLERLDRVRHAVGALRAAALQQVTATASGAASAHITDQSPDAVREFAKRPIEIDIGAFERMVAAIGTNLAMMDDFLAAFDGVVDLTYESYLADKAAFLDRIATAAGVEPFAAPPDEILKKISSDDLRVAVANYDELMRSAERLGLEA
jgi:LPS sulfotransferase NodH